MRVFCFLPLGFFRTRQMLPVPYNLGFRSQQGTAISYVAFPISHPSFP
jgi:hypothetical protein